MLGRMRAGLRQWRAKRRCSSFPLRWPRSNSGPLRKPANSLRLHPLGERVWHLVPNAGASSMCRLSYVADMATGYVVGLTPGGHPPQQRPSGAHC